MALTTRIAGGTRSGRRKPFQGRREPWRCLCWGLRGFPGVGENDVIPESQRKLNPGFLARCPDCGMKAP